LDFNWIGRGEEVERKAADFCEPVTVFKGSVVEWKKKVKWATV